MLLVKLGHVLHPLAVRREAVERLIEGQRLPADDAVESRVADRAPYPVVQAVLEVRRQRVGVAHAPAAHQRLADVGLVVAVGVLQSDQLASLRDDDAAVHEDQAAHDTQLVGEDRRPVGAAVVVGVLQNFDDVVALAVLLQVVRIVLRLGNPQPAARVPGHRFRVPGDQRLGGEQLQLEPRRDLEVLRRLARRERLLQSRRGTPAFVVRDRDDAVGVAERRELERRELRRDMRSDGPGDGVPDQRVEIRIAPDLLVVAVGGVEDPPAPLGPHPRPRLTTCRVDALHQHGTVGWIVRGVDGGLVPDRERLQPLHHRMRGVHERRRELAGPWRWSCAPTSATYAGEFRKEADAEWIGRKPLPPATKSSSAFSWSGAIAS